MSPPLLVPAFVLLAFLAEHLRHRYDGWENAMLWGWPVDRAHDVERKESRASFVQVGAMLAALTTALAGSWGLFAVGLFASFAGALGTAVWGDYHFQGELNIRRDPPREYLDPDELCTYDDERGTHRKLFCGTGRRLQRPVGALLISAYLAFLAFLLVL